MNIPIVSWPWLQGHEVGVVANQYEPAVTRCDPISTAVESLGSDLQPVRVRTATNIDFYPDAVTRFGDNRQLRARDLFDVRLKLHGCQKRRARRFRRDDNLSLTSAVLHDEGVGGLECNRMRQQQDSHKE